MFLAAASTVHCVDPWQPYSDIGDCKPGGISNMHAVERIFDKRAKIFPGRIIKCKSASPAAARLFPDFSFDCVYIDGAHNETAVTDDIRAWIWKIRPGGILAGHDYGHMDYGGVKRAVDKHFGKPDALYPDFTWVVKGGADGPIHRLVPGPVQGQPLSGTGLDAQR